MIRVLTLAAVAALAATSANAAGIKVSLAGKSDAQVRAEVVSAARSVCLRQTQSETLVVDAYHRCVKATVKTAYQKLDANGALAKNDTVAAR